MENNQYFPPGSIKKEHFKPSNHTSHCPWKGDASYYTVSANGQVSSARMSCYAGESTLVLCACFRPAFHYTLNFLFCCPGE